MRKASTIFALIFIFAFFCGCGTKSHFCVSVDTIVNKKALEKGSFNQGSSFCVKTDIKDTPLLSDEIQEKIERALVKKGFEVTNACDKAQYFLIFRYAMTSSSQTLHITQPSSSFIDSSGCSAAVSHTPEVSGDVNVVAYHRGIAIFVYDSKAIADKKDGLVWQGTSVSTGFSNDLRYVSDYLLMPLFKYFGLSSNRILQFDIPEESKDIKEFKKELSFMNTELVLDLYYK